jgi:hypothetical protein
MVSGWDIIEILIGVAILSTLSLSEIQDLARDLPTATGWLIGRLSIPAIGAVALLDATRRILARRRNVRRSKSASAVGSGA